MTATPTPLRDTIDQMRDIADVAERYSVEELRDVLREQARRLAAVAPAGMDGVVREEVDREVRGGRIFYFRHNPPNTMLAQIFNNILLANGTYEADNAKHQSRENAARAQLGVLATAATPPATAGQEDKGCNRNCDCVGECKAGVK